MLDLWQSLKQFTPARIALGRAGAALPTTANLQFQLDHARARDAVHLPMDVPALVSGIEALQLSPVLLQSLAGHRQQYLQRPDLGRQLAEVDWQRLAGLKNEAGFDIAIIVGDGLSAAAVNHHALPVLAELLPSLGNAGYSLAPLCIARQARVALADDIGEALGARLSLMLIGERPGLSSPDSLGIYLTYEPERGCHDAQRNCISNIRPDGLSYQQASETCLYLLVAALRKKLSGVELKDDSHRLDEVGSDYIPFLKQAT
jgi:ethanolamine ammonia-lyase small subunit